MVPNNRQEENEKEERKRKRDDSDNENDNRKKHRTDTDEGNAILSSNQNIFLQISHHFATKNLFLSKLIISLKKSQTIIQTNGKKKEKESARKTKSAKKIEKTEIVIEIEIAIEKENAKKIGKIGTEIETVIVIETEIAIEIENAKKIGKTEIVIEKGKANEKGTERNGEDQQKSDCKIFFFCLNYGL